MLLIREYAVFSPFKKEGPSMNNVVGNKLDRTLRSVIVTVINFGKGMVSVLNSTSLKAKISISFSVLFFTCLTVVGFFVYRSMTNAIQDIAITYLQETLKQVNDKIDNTLREVENTSSTAVSSFNLQILLNKEVDYLTLKERTLVNSSLTSAANQNPYLSALQVYSPKYGYYGFNDSVMEAAEIRRRTFESLKTDIKDRMVWLTFERRDRRSPYILGVRGIPNFMRGAELGHLFAVVDGGKIDEDIKKINLGAGGKVFLLNEADQVIAGSGDISLREMELFRRMIGEQERNGSLRSIETIDGSRSLITYSASAKTNWKTVAVLPVSSLTSGIDHIKTVLLWGYFVSVVFIVLSAGILSSRISKPIRHMQRVMRRVESGELHLTLPRTNTSELNELGHSFNRMVYRLRLLIDRVYESELRQREAEMKALQAQINPHFMYNTLDSFYWLLTIRKQNDLAKDVVAFSNLFRYTIGNQEETVPLKQEFEHIANYLRIQKLRFEKLEFECVYEPAIERVETVKMLLQPLVENAIYHGLERRAERGRLEISAIKSGDDVVISIRDDGAGMEEEELRRVRRSLQQVEQALTSKREGAGIGLENVNARIKLMHGERYGLEIESKRGEGTRVLVQIPFAVVKEDSDENRIGGR